MSSRAHYPHPHYPAVAQRQGELDHAQRWWLLRRGRAQGAIAVVALLIFWRVALLGLVAYGIYRVAGRGSERRAERRAHRTERQQRWARRHGRWHRGEDAPASPMILPNLAAHDLDQVERMREHKAALAAFDRKLVSAPRG